MNIDRWSIWLADLEPIIGSEQGKRRPMLVISKSAVNKVLPVVNALPITSRKPGRKVYSNEALLPKGTAGLDNESIVLCYQIRTLDKSRLTQRFGEVDDLVIRDKVIDALCWQIQIPH